MLTKEFIAERLMKLQDSICAAIENEDGKGKFTEEKWEREGGGGGRSRVMIHGDVIEKGGVNFSAVHGKLPEKIRIELKVDDNNFFATGVSIVFHPNSPLMPIIHMNVRYFELANGDYWFGGGIDLTPHYIDRDDARWFHQQLKNVCDKHDNAYYSKFKKWADEYFFIPHRNETRGIGGIFFDRLSSNHENGKQQIFDFVIGLGEIFAPIYSHFMKLKRTMSFGEVEKQWQMLRRGRYVEFNLVYDRGTKFGLETQGRTESILMSLPENASWLYGFVPKENSAESQTISLLKKDIDWLANGK